MQHSDAVLLHITVFKDSVLTPHLGATPDAAAHYSHLHVRMSEPRPGWIIQKHQATEQEFILEGASPDSCSQG